MYDVAITLQDKAIGLYGAGFAGLAAIALLCRYSGQYSKGKTPKGFPLDPSATLERYVQAYSDLISESARYSLPSPTSPIPLTAKDYAQKMFGLTNIVIRNDKPGRASKELKKK